MLKTLSTIIILFFLSLGSITIYSLSQQRDFSDFDQINTWTKSWVLFENYFLDFRQKFFLNQNTSKNIVYLDIDDNSISKIGRFPWSRKTWSEVVNKLNQAQAKVISFDIYFSEDESTKPETLSADKLFTNSIKKFQNTGGQVILPYSAVVTQLSNSSTEGFYSEIPPSLYNTILSGSLVGSKTAPYKIETRVFPTETILEAEPMLGHVQALADLDGVFRHYTLVVFTEGLVLPSLSLATAQSFLGLKNYKIEVQKSKPVLIWDQQQIHLNELGETTVNWHYPEKYFAKINVFDLLNSPLSSLEFLKNKIIFIGSSAYGAHDLRNTPLGPATPGVFFHMNKTEELLNFIPKKSFTLNTQYSYLLLLIVMLLSFIFIIFLKSFSIQLFLHIVLVLSILLFDKFWAMPNGFKLYLLPIISSLVLGFSSVQALIYYFTKKEKKLIQSAFSRYLSPSIVKELMNDPKKLKLGGEKKEITIFFSDIRSFTSISESLKPEVLAQALNYYMTEMTNTLFEYNGTLDKYIGDAIVAYWGAPVPVENHAFQALCAAQKMTENLKKINLKFRLDNIPDFKHGIGINTGPCIVGNMGSEQIFSYTAIGDQVNLCARTESLCKFYGAEILFTNKTLENLAPAQKAELKYRQVDRVVVKGKSLSVDLFELLPSHHPLFLDAEFLNQFNLAFSLYLNRQFAEAENILIEFIKKYSEDLCAQHLLSLCKELQNKDLPENWNGIFEHKEK